MNEKAQVHTEYVAKLERLWDMVSDMVEGGRLREADAPDDYAALVQQMVDLQALHHTRAMTAEVAAMPATMAAKYISTGADLVTVEGTARVIASDHNSGLVHVRYETGLFAGRERVESALHEGFAALVGEGQKVEATRKASLGIPAGWELASGYTLDLFDGVGRAICEKRFGGEGTPYVACDMTVVESRTGGYIPIHGSVRMNAVGSVSDAVATLASYWDSLPASSRVAAQPSGRSVRNSTSLGM